MPRHAGGDRTEAGPGVQPAMERDELRRRRQAGEPREAECGHEGPATISDHEGSFEPGRAGETASFSEGPPEHDVIE